MTATPAKAADGPFRLVYEGLHHLEGPWCTVNVYSHRGVPLIVATDEGEHHKDCSITNRIERVMFLAWEQAGKPWPCFFVECYPERDGGMIGRHFDLVAFETDHADKPALSDCWSAGRVVGQQFKSPHWRPVREEGPMAFLFTTEATR